MISAVCEEQEQEGRTDAPASVTRKGTVSGRALSPPRGEEGKMHTQQR